MEHRRIARVLDTVASQPEGALPQRLCDGAAELLDAAGVGVALSAGNDLLETIYATDAARRGEQLQTDLGEGPRYSAHASGWPILVEDLALDDTWPMFAPAACEQGLGAVFSFRSRCAPAPCGREPSRSTVGTPATSVTTNTPTLS